MANDKSREQALKARVASEREAAGKRRVRFSKWVRREAVELAVACGTPKDRFAEEMGIGKTSLRKWIGAADDAEPVRRSQPPRLRRVAVQTSPLPAGMDSFDLVFPSGARVLGLNDVQLLRLLGVSR